MPAQIQLYGDVPVGAARFADLAQGNQGVGYRRSKVDFVSAVRCLSPALPVLGASTTLPAGGFRTAACSCGLKDTACRRV